MPQSCGHSHIIQNLNDFMSTILIHKQIETLGQIIPANKCQNKTIQYPLNIKWEEVAGLSWILLEREDEY